MVLTNSEKNQDGKKFEYHGDISEVTPKIQVITDDKSVLIKA